MDKNTKRVLLIEDEEALLFGLTRLLQDGTTIIDTARTLLEAKKFLNTNTYQVVITDLRLTNAAIIEGFDIITLARQLQKDIKIIVITAYSENSTREHVKSLGADFFLEKPVSPKQIKEILDTLGNKPAAIA